MEKTIKAWAVANLDKSLQESMPLALVFSAAQMAMIHAVFPIKENAETYAAKLKAAKLKIKTIPCTITYKLP